MKHKRGFTLLELIIVIAIIGIISAVMMALLGDARGKGSDASIRSQLTSARSQAELYYYQNDSSYLGVCNASLTDDPKGIADFLAAANAENGVNGTATCVDNAVSWALEVQLVRDSELFVCVHTGGDAGIFTGSTIGGGDYTCGP